MEKIFKSVYWIRTGRGLNGRLYWESTERNAIDREEELQKRAYKKISVTKAIELYQTILNQPIEVREALFNALGRDLNDEVRGD